MYVSNIFIIPGDAEPITADSCRKLTLVEETDGEVFHEVDRKLLLPGICALVSAPFDIAGPTGHGGQVQR